MAPLVEQLVGVGQPGLVHRGGALQVGAELLLHGVDVLVEGPFGGVLAAAADQRQRLFGARLLRLDRQVGQGFQRVGGGVLRGAARGGGDRQRRTNPDHHQQDSQPADHQAGIDAAAGALGQPAVRVEPEQHRRRDHQHHRGGQPGGGAGLGVDAGGGLVVQPLGVGQDRVLHQRRRLGQVTGAHRVAGPVVGAGDLHQPGVDGELGVDASQQPGEFLVGQPRGGAGDRVGGVGDGLLVAVPDLRRLGLRDERGRGGGVGHRQGGVELAGGRGQRLGVVEHRGQRVLAVVDGRGGGERAEQPQRGQHHADDRDLAGSRAQKPPVRVGRLGRRRRSFRLGRRMRQLHGHVL